MDDSAAKAVAAHQAGCNCCQAVVTAFCEKYGISREDAMRISAAFGSGMRRGEVCGAVVGALMVLGMKNGCASSDSDSATVNFMKAFQERHGSYLCRDLLKAAGRKICPQLVASACGMLDDFGC